MTTAIAEQLTLPGFPVDPATYDRYPKVHNIATSFRWVRVDYIMSLPSVDFYADGLSTEENRDHKRRDQGYEDLVESIRTEGFYDPVFLYEDSPETLGNGHHRVVAAYDLGYTHVPVTSNPDVQWDTNYPGHPDYVDPNYA